MDSGFAPEPAIGPATSGRTRWARPGMTAEVNLPLTISVFTPLTLGRHPAAGRLPFGTRVPEVGWFGSFRGNGTGGCTLRCGEGVAPVPDRCRRRRLKLGAGHQPGAGAAAAAAANSQ